MLKIKENNKFKYVLKPSLIFILILSLSSCISGRVRHGFNFDVRAYSPGIEVLNYRYGSKDFTNIEVSEYHLESGFVKQQDGIYGSMRRGDELYVKWKVLSSNRIYEDTVDLKKALPVFMKEHRIRFIISGKQLHVYVISPYKWKPNPCLPREKRIKLKQMINPDNKILSTYCSFKVRKIYPTTTENNIYKFWE